jgi:hypothetical protein
LWSEGRSDWVHASRNGRGWLHRHEEQADAERPNLGHDTLPSSGQEWFLSKGVKRLFEQQLMLQNLPFVTQTGQGNCEPDI